MPRKLSDNPKNVARRAKRAAAKLNTKAQAALETLNKELGTVTTKNPTSTTPGKISTPAERKKWNMGDAYKAWKLHHMIGPEEVEDLLSHLGGHEFMEATGARVGHLSEVGSLHMMFGKPGYPIDGHKVVSIDLLATSETGYDIRLLAFTDDTNTITDERFLGGLEIVRTIENIQIDKLREALDDAGIDTWSAPGPVQKAQQLIDFALEHVSKCDCEGCTAEVARAKKEGKTLLEVIAETSPPIRAALEVVKGNTIAPADKAQTADKVAATEDRAGSLSSIVEGIKKAALADAEVDEQTQARIREAFKRSLVVVPDKQTVN